MTVVESVVRLASALLLTGLLGLERERRGKAAGLRTHMMVGLGAAAFMLIALDLARVGFTDTHVRVDPSRVLEGVLGGIGFLGAGSIIQSRSEVHGMTTAAGIWVAGGIGVACGVGEYLLAVLTTVLALATLILLPIVERRIAPRDQ